MGEPRLKADRGDKVNPVAAGDHGSASLAGSRAAHLGALQGEKSNAGSRQSGEFVPSVALRSLMFHDFDLVDTINNESQKS
jgi:hypothetical protein